MAKVGKPTKYLKKYDKLIYKVMCDGGNISTFCGDIVVHYDTFINWCKAFPSFKIAYEQGKEVGKIKMYKKVYDAAFDPKANPVNNTMVSLYLYNVYGIRSEASHNKEQEDNNNNKVDLNISVIKD